MVKCLWTWKHEQNVKTISGFDHFPVFSLIKTLLCIRTDTTSAFINFVDRKFAFFSPRHRCAVRNSDGISYTHSAKLIRFNRFGRRSKRMNSTPHRKIQRNLLQLYSKNEDKKKNGIPSHFCSIYFDTARTSIKVKFYAHKFKTQLKVNCCRRKV